MKSSPRIKRIVFFGILLIFVLFGSIVPVRAQGENELSLRISKNFGYSSFAGEIQGTFTMKAGGPENLERVVFYIDNQEIGEVTEPPFKLKFNTDDYGLGLHSLSATGFTSDGRELNSNVLTREFVSASEGTQTTLKLVGGILGLVVGVSLVAFLISYFAGGKKKASVPLGAPRTFGPLGGTVCPKCGRPFSRHVWGLNIGVGKFDRCPHCGKWSIVSRASPAELDAAVKVELELEDKGEQAPAPSEEEKLRIIC
jgi:hypothetical protein